MTQWVQLVGGGLLLYFGAECFVGGASALALRVRQLIIGLTVVAYGTSAPEVIVGVDAAQADHGALALGNVLGSNIANIGLILGVAALIRPARVDGALRRRELPVLVATTALVPLLLLDGVVTWWESAGLVAAAVAVGRAGRGRGDGEGRGRSGSAAPEEPREGGGDRRHRPGSAARRGQPVRRRGGLGRARAGDE